MRKLLGIYTSVMFCFLGMSAQTMAALDGGTPTWCDDLQIRTANLTTAVQSERGFQKELRDTVESLQGVCASVSEAKEFEVDVLMRALVMAEMLSSTANIEIIDSMRTYGIIRDSFTIRSLQPIFLALIALTRHQKISTEGKVAGTVSVLFDDSIKAVLGDRFSLYSTQLRKSMSPFFKIYTSCLDDITKRAAPALALPGRVPSHGGGVGAGTSPLPYAPPPHFSPSSYPIPITVVETIVLDHTGAVVSSSRVSTPGGMLMASGGLPTAFATAIPDADLESSRVTTRVTVVPTTATRVPSAPPMVATPTGPSPKVGSGAGGPAKREGAPVPPPAKRGAGDEFKRDAATRGGGSTVAIKEVEPEDQVTVISHAEQLSEAALKYNRATTGVTSALDRGVNPEFFLKTQAESVREITMLVGQLFQEKFEPAAVLRVINLNKELMANLIVNLGEIAGSIESDQVLQCMEIMETTCKSLFPRKYDHLFPPK